MAFIIKEDYESVINENVLDDITEIDDDKLEACQKRAIAFIDGYLNNRYDTNAIFSKTGAERNAVILGLAIDITLYYLHRIVNWRNAPAARVNAYNEAKDWLEKVNALQINPSGLPVVAGDTDRDYIQTGSNPKRSNHI
jgi:phage gp36-like protein